MEQASRSWLGERNKGYSLLHIYATETGLRLTFRETVEDKHIGSNMKEIVVAER